MLSERHSVTSFIESKGKILILLRSELVRTHPNKWGGISGSIDNDKTADEQAMIEIEEETGLSAENILLIKKGEPIIINDEHHMKVIHPYLFHVKNRDAIKLNWENKQIKWIRPEDIDKYDTMPRLKDTLAQVLSLNCKCSKR